MGEQAVDYFGLAGSVLDGKYRVDDPVAGGGFGVVYRGHHLRLDVPLAIKVLKPNRLLSGELRAEAVGRFLAEARTTAKLRHPYIAQVLDAGLAHTDELPEGVPWMVLEWLEGETLECQLEARRGCGGRSPKDVLALLRPVLEAMAFAHDAGVVHRDLKPANVMLTPHGPRIVDFGIAKLMEGPTTVPTGQTYTDAALVAFSPGYAAPEQVSRSRTGFWTDVHALALMLCELLADKQPYQADEETTLLAAVVAHQRPTPATLGVDVGPWEDVLRRALSLRAGERHENAGELLRELEATVEGAQQRFLSRSTGEAHSAPSPGARAASGIPGITPAYGDDSTVPASSTLPAQAERRPRWGLRVGLGLTALTLAIGVGLVALRGTSSAPVTPSAASVGSAVAAPPVELSALAPTPSAQLPDAAAAASAVPDAGKPPVVVERPPASPPRPPTAPHPPTTKSTASAPLPAPTRVTPTSSFE